MNRVSSFVMVGVGGLFMSMAGGCATTDSTTTTAAQTAQFADQACLGVPAKERELGLLAYRDALGGAEKLQETEQVGKVKIARDRGVDIAVRAQPGMTAPWLERVASCHIAAVASGQAPTTPAGVDPLLVTGATVRVQETGTGYVVSVRVPDDRSASEVSKRTQALLTTPSGTTVSLR
jgi:hypothetical protein